MSAVPKQLETREEVLAQWCQMVRELPPEIMPAELALSRINALESWLMALPDEQKVSFQNLHDFTPGLYARSIIMGAGTVCTSRIHKTRHMFVVAQGCCTVINSDGSRATISAPFLGTTPAWTKRALLIHEDTVWTTFHPLPFTTVEECEDALFAESWDERQEFES